MVLASVPCCAENSIYSVRQLRNSCSFLTFLLLFSVKLRIPDDGNLYHLSSKKFIDLLLCLNLDRQVIDACCRRRMDGKLFSRLSEREMECSGLMNPVLLHFRRLTMKKSK